MSSTITHNTQPHTATSGVLHLPGAEMPRLGTISQVAPVVEADGGSQRNDAQAGLHDRQGMRGSTHFGNFQTR